MSRCPVVVAIFIHIGPQCSLHLKGSPNQALLFTLGQDYGPRSQQWSEPLPLIVLSIAIIMSSSSNFLTLHILPPPVSFLDGHEALSSCCKIGEAIWRVND